MVGGSDLGVSTRHVVELPGGGGTTSWLSGMALTEGGKGTGERGGVKREDDTKRGREKYTRVNKEKEKD